MKDKMNLLVTLADRNYVKQAKQLFSSVYWNAGWKGDCMLLASEIPEKELKWFRKKRILIRKCKPFYDKNGKPKTVLSKFYLFTPYFKEWGNVIYLDADVIVRASLDNLTGIGGFAARPGTKLKNQFIKKENSEKIFQNLKENYNLNERAFNAGVMSFSTAIIRNDTLSKLIKIHGRYKEFLKCEDQGVLNLFFYKKFIKLHYLYNCWPYYTKHFYRINSEKINAAVLHFMHNTKPWFPDSPFSQEWKNNLDKADSINLKKPRNPGNIISEQEILEYREYLRKGKKIYFFNKILWDLAETTDRYTGILTKTTGRCIGIIGFFLKCHLPQLYFKLKKLKEK